MPEQHVTATNIVDSAAVMALFGEVVQCVWRQSRLPMSALLGLVRPHLERTIQILGASEKWPTWDQLSDEVCASLMAQIQSAFAVPEMLLEDFTHRIYSAAVALQDAARAGDFFIRVPIPENLG